MGRSEGAAGGAARQPGQSAASQCVSASGRVCGAMPDTQAPRGGGERRRSAGGAAGEGAGGGAHPPRVAHAPHSGGAGEGIKKNDYKKRSVTKKKKNKKKRASSETQAVSERSVIHNPSAAADTSLEQTQPVPVPAAHRGSGSSFPSLLDAFILFRSTSTSLLNESMIELATSRNQKAPCSFFQIITTGEAVPIHLLLPHSLTVVNYSPAILRFPCGLDTD